MTSSHMFPIPFPSYLVTLLKGTGHIVQCFFFIMWRRRFPGFQCSHLSSCAKNVIASTINLLKRCSKRCLHRARMHSSAHLPRLARLFRNSCWYRENYILYVTCSPLQNCPNRLLGLRSHLCRYLEQIFSLVWWILLRILNGGNLCPVCWNRTE